MKITIKQLRKLISFELRSKLNEGFKDDLKSFGKAALVATSLAGSAHANPISLSDSPMIAADNDESSNDIIIIKDPEGNEHKFYWLIEVIVSGKRYCALEHTDNQEIFLFEYKITKYGEQLFKEIEDESTWEEVKNAVEKELDNEDE